MSVNSESHTRPPFFILIYIYRKFKWKNQELGNAHLQRGIALPGLWAESRSSKSWLQLPQNPVPAHTTQSALASEHFKNLRGFLKGKEVHACTRCEAHLWSPEGQAGQ